MHDSVIAKWILHVPEKLKEKRAGNFDQFVYGVDAHIEFNYADHPNYYLFNSF